VLPTVPIGWTRRIGVLTCPFLSFFVVVVVVVVGGGGGGGGGVAFCPGEDYVLVFSAGLLLAVSHGNSPSTHN
jgi:hypothetical protein